MSETLLKPEIVVFAGPNGSGKTTITSLARTVGQYINADQIKNANLCSDLEAAQIATELRERAVDNNDSFTFETVLSTDRNLLLLKRAKEKGYFIRCIYILTANPVVNVSRVRVRMSQGGHEVPEDKIVSRYYKALNLIPKVVEVCDVMHIYDNTKVPFRIFKKRKDKFFYWENEFWNKDNIEKLTGVDF